jgi:hypothetical protein
MPPRPRCQSRPKPAGAAWRCHAGRQWPHAALLRPRGGRCRVPPGWPGAWSARQARLPLRALATFLVPTEVHNGTSCMLAPRGPVHTQPKRRPLFSTQAQCPVVISVEPRPESRHVASMSESGTACRAGRMSSRVASALVTHGNTSAVSNKHVGSETYPKRLRKVHRTEQLGE